MQASVKLYFDSNKYELQKLIFSSKNLQQENISIRGSATNLPLKSKTFTWSAAVSALSMLFLNTFLGIGKLKGLKGSPAFSLDYALSKQPNWLLEMFSVDISGNSNFLRLVYRINPNGKRSTPVEIILKGSVNVEIFLDHALIDQATAQQILEKLESSWVKYGERRIIKNKELEYRQKDKSEIIFNLLEKEISTAFDNTRVFSRKEIDEKLKSLFKNPSFKREGGKNINILYGIDSGLSTAERLGVCDQGFIDANIIQEKPLKVAVGFSTVACIALFTHLQNLYPDGFRIDTSFMHALDVATRIIKQDVTMDHDLCAIADAPAASMLRHMNQHEYLPLMFLPQTSQRMVSPNRKSKSSQAQNLLFLLENPSTSLFYYESLLEKNFVKTRDKITHREPFESWKELAEEDSRTKAILFFPYYQMNVLYNNCSMVQHSNFSEYHSEMILFAKKSLLVDKKRTKAVVLAVKKAWTDLFFNKNLIGQTTKEIMSDPMFNVKLKRFTGMSL